MSTPLSPDIPVSKDVMLLLAPVYLGALMAFLLFGISIMQLYHYSLSYPQDHIAIKSTVYGVFLLDIFQSFAVAVLGFYILCSGWGRPLSLLELNWTFCSIPAATGIIAAWVQGFYAWRIHKISQWTILPALILLIALMQCAGALSITIGIPALADVTQLHTLYRRTFVWLGGAAAADVIIAIAMLYLLFTVRRNKYDQTQRVINRLIRLTVETGVVTATCAFLELIMFQVLPNTNMHIFFAAMLAKVYSNALMTSLNSRNSQGRRGDVQHGGATSQQYSTSSYTNAGQGTGRSVHNPLSSFHAGPVATTGGPTVVHISTSTEREADYAFEEDDMKTKDALSGIVRQDSFPITRMSGTTADSDSGPASPRY